MDAWGGAAGWIVALVLAGLHVIRSRWHGAIVAQLRRQLSETERELWQALRRAGYWESQAAGVRNGWQLPVTTIPPDKKKTVWPPPLTGDNILKL